MIRSLKLADGALLTDASGDINLPRKSTGVFYIDANADKTRSARLPGPGTNTVVGRAWISSLGDSPRREDRFRPTSHEKTVQITADAR